VEAVWWGTAVLTMYMKMVRMCRMADAMVRAVDVATKKSVRKFAEESKLCMSPRLAAVLDDGRSGDQAELLAS
jgi:hypothetical protein